MVSKERVNEQREITFFIINEGIEKGVRCIMNFTQDKNKLFGHLKKNDVKK